MVIEPTLPQPCQRKGYAALGDRYVK
jgi:hypothetical protein